jgi:alcohol dehydrogenase
MPKNEFPKYYEFFNSVKIISGYKALESMSSELDLLGIRKPIIITDQGVAKAGLAEHVIKSFGGTKIKLGALYDTTPIDSDISAVNEIAKIYREVNADSIIAVGGGSVIDTAKGVNIVISEETDDLMRLTGNNRLTKPMKPFVVIPTTAGTGSEVTMAAVIANPARNIKMQFTSPLMLPKLAVLDPVMTISMPPKITGATAMDALTHAVEAYVGPQKNPVSDAFAVAAIELIRDNLPNALSHGSNQDFRLAMANAALLAGVAFSNSMVGVVHALAHSLGGLCHVPHGVGNMIMLPHGLEFYSTKSPVIAARIGHLHRYLLTPEECIKIAPDETPKSTVNAIRELSKILNKRCGLPLTLNQAGVSDDQLAAVAKTAINDGAIAYSPVEVNEQEALGILKAAY